SDPTTGVCLQGWTWQATMAGESLSGGDGSDRSLRTPARKHGTGDLRRTPQTERREPPRLPIARERGHELSQSSCRGALRPRGSSQDPSGSRRSAPLLIQGEVKERPAALGADEKSESPRTSGPPRHISLA